MRSLKSNLFALGILVFAIPAHAQQPDWTVDLQSYQYSMTLVTFLSVDHRILQGEDDRVAAFIDGEVHGVASPIYIASADRYLAYLTVYANHDKEPVTFKLYESATGHILDVEATIPFEIDGQLGSSFQAFSLATPPLSNEAEIRNFYFEDVDSVSTQIANDTVDIVVEYDQDIMNLSPGFVLSDGARLYLNRALLVPGAATYDYSQPVVYAVLSADESVLKEWVVVVRNREVTSVGFDCANVVTANNDGANDFWVVKDAFQYKNHRFRIFDANGRIVFESVGYNNDWNATYKGSKLARGKYHFIVSDPESSSVYHGSILVLY